MYLKETIGKVANQVGAIVTIVGGMSLSEWGILSGIALGLAGFAATQYWQWKRYNLLKRYKEFESKNPVGTFETVPAKLGRD